MEKSIRNQHPLPHLKVRQRGISVVEMAVVAAISIVVLAYSLAPVSGTQSDNRADAEVQALSIIVPSAQKTYANVADYSTATQASLVQNNVFPTADVVSGSTNLVNRWGGTITAAPATLNGVANAGLALTYSGVPTQECTDVAGQLDSLMGTITINGTTTKAYAQPSVAASIGSACAAGNNTMVFTFSK